MAYRFEKMLSRHGADIPRQTLTRWVIQSDEQLQPLLNLMRGRLLDYPVLHLGALPPRNPGCGCKAVVHRISR